jgi:hypothetical protein
MACFIDLPPAVVSRLPSEMRKIPFERSIVQAARFINPPAAGMPRHGPKKGESFASIPEAIFLRSFTETKPAFYRNEISACFDLPDM